MGPRFHALDRASSRRAQRRESRLGGSRKHLFLDRSLAGDCRSHFDATPAVRRSESAGSTRRVRASRVLVAHLIMQTNLMTASLHNQPIGAYLPSILLNAATERRTRSGSIWGLRT